jgi:transposase
MIALPTGTQIWIACGVTDLRKGFDGLAALVQMQLAEDIYSGQLFVFRGRRGDRVKLLWWDGDGLCLFCKRLESGKFVAAGQFWHGSSDGSAALDASRGDRLAARTTHAGAADGGVS